MTEFKEEMVLVPADLFAVACRFAAPPSFLEERLGYVSIAGGPGDSIQMYATDRSNLFHASFPARGNLRPKSALALEPTGEIREALQVPGKIQLFREGFEAWADPPEWMVPDRVLIVSFDEPTCSVNVFGSEPVPADRLEHRDDWTDEYALYSGRAARGHPPLCPERALGIVEFDPDQACQGIALPAWTLTKALSLGLPVRIYRAANQQGFVVVADSGGGIDIRIAIADIAPESESPKLRLVETRS